MSETMTAREFWPIWCRQQPINSGPFTAEEHKLAFAEAYHAYRTRWIPCSERLPEKNDEYIIVDDGEAFSRPADFRDGQWFTVRSFGIDSEPRELYNVTHWQPLPAPEDRK